MAPPRADGSGSTLLRTSGRRASSSASRQMTMRSRCRRTVTGAPRGANTRRALMEADYVLIPAPPERMALEVVQQQQCRSVRQGESSNSGKDSGRAFTRPSACANVGRTSGASRTAASSTITTRPPNASTSEAATARARRSCRCHPARSASADARHPATAVGGASPVPARGQLGAWEESAGCGQDPSGRSASDRERGGRRGWQHLYQRASRSTRPPTALPGAATAVFRCNVHPIAATVRTTLAGQCAIGCACTVPRANVDTRTAMSVGFGPFYSCVGHRLATG